MLRHYGFLPLLLLTCLPALNQQLYRVKEFSPKYYGRVWLAKPSETVSPGWVAVYERTTGRQLLKVKSQELALQPEPGKAVVAEALQYQDFNLDGVKDLAVASGSADWHGTTYSLYRIYLARGSQFIFSKEFSTLPIDHLNHFEPDSGRKTFAIDRIQYKGFYTSHDYYALQGNRPQLLRNVWDSWETHPYNTTTTTTYQNKNSHTRERVDLELQEIDPLLEFKLRNGKRVLLFSTSRSLHYNLLKPNGDEYEAEVEFFYPYFWAEETTFRYKTTRTYRVLEFNSGPNVYRIYESLARTGRHRLGVAVITPRKTVVLPAVPGSQRGSLKPLFP